MRPLCRLNKLIHVKHFKSYLVHGKNQMVTVCIADQATYPRSCSYLVAESGFILSLSDFKGQALKTMHDSFLNTLCGQEFPGELRARIHFRLKF